MAVALGRMARSGALPSSYLARLVSTLASGERADDGLRGAELSAAPGEDPLDDVLSALAGTRDADTAAALLCDRRLWFQFLGRMWTDGFDGLDGLLRLAADGSDGAEVAATVLDAVGSGSRLMVDQTGSTIRFTVASLSPAIGQLVARHLTVVTEVVVVGLNQPGAPGRSLDPAEERMLRGLGMVTLDPTARVAVLRALVEATSASPPAVGAGAQSPAAYVHGGIFAAIAYGEAQDIRRQLVSATAVAENQELCWSVVTAPLGFIRLPRFRKLWDTATGATSFLGPDGIPLGEFLAQPATGAPQAAFSAVVAAMPTLVREGLLPDPGAVLDGGLGAPEARCYVSALPGAGRDAFDEVYSGAESGFLDVGDSLGILPGSG